MKQILIICAMAFTVGAKSQTVIADETILKETKGSVRVNCSNEFIIGKIIAYFKPKTYTVREKVDRNGPYREHQFSFPIAMKDSVVTYIKRLK